MRIQTLNKAWLKMLVGSGALILIIIALLCPIRTKSTEAIDNTIRSAAALVSVDATAMVAISLDTSVNMTATPKTSAGAFSYGNAQLSVTTNSPAGYSVYMKTSNGENTLHSDKAENTQVISSITKDTTGSSLAGNTWGYTMGDQPATESSTYKPIPTTINSPIYKTNTLPSSGSQDVYQLGFGAHIDQSLPAGTYTNEVIVSVVANPTTISNLNDLVYMQDMTPEICAATAEHTTKELIDARDDGSGETKKYWVTKLKDGNCWMTENLDYDFVAGKVLTSADSDVTWNWTIPFSTLNAGTPINTPPSSETRPSYAYVGSWHGNNNSTGHQSVGNYYTWAAAKADHGGEKGSICPKGWKLPDGGDDATTSPAKTDSFYNLLKQYGLTEHSPGTSIDGVTYNINNDPLFFVFGGAVTPNDGAINVAGYSGEYWSNTETNSSNTQQQAYEFTTNYDGAVRPSSLNAKDYGRSIRCVAK